MFKTSIFSDDASQEECFFILTNLLIFLDFLQLKAEPTGKKYNFKIKRDIEYYLIRSRFYLFQVPTSNAKRVDVVKYNISKLV